METSRLLIKPVIHYPRVAQVGKTYLMTIDIQTEEIFSWQEEECLIYCCVSSNSFKINPVSEPIVILHRLGNSYGESKFLLEAMHECSECTINISLNNQWGVSIINISLESSIVAKFSKKEKAQDNSKFLRFSKGEGSQDNSAFRKFYKAFKPLIDKIYSETVATWLITEVFELIQKSLSPSGQENLKKWNHNDILLITYGDSIVDSQRFPLEVLAEFLENYLEDTVTGIHILSFFPYSSDDGFAVIDYLKVNSKLGNWKHIKRIAQHFNLMVDGRIQRLGE